MPTQGRSSLAILLLHSLNISSPFATYVPGPSNDVLNIVKVAESSLLLLTLSYQALQIPHLCCADNPFYWGVSSSCFYSVSQCRAHTGNAILILKRLCLGLYFFNGVSATHDVDAGKFNAHNLVHGFIACSQFTFSGLF